MSEQKRERGGVLLWKFFIFLSQHLIFSSKQSISVPTKDDASKKQIALNSIEDGEKDYGGKSGYQSTYCHFHVTFDLYIDVIIKYSNQSLSDLASPSSSFPSSSARKHLLPL